MSYDNAGTSFDDPEGQGKTLGLWYFDGTLVIHARGTLFRVYAGVLSTKSPVLEERITKLVNRYHGVCEGCPVLNLPDATLDMYYFLMALHDASPFFGGPMWDRFSAVSALLRLGTKYEVDSLRDKAIESLSEVYPSSLAAYTKRRRIQETVEAYQLIRSMNLVELLPAVSYECATVSTPRTLVSSGIEDEHLIRILDGARTLSTFHTRLFRAIQSDALSASKSSGKLCKSPQKCTANKLMILHDLYGYTGTLDPLAPSFPGLNWAQYEEQTCRTCTTKAKSKYNHTREWVWNKLPGIFGLPKWGTILLEDDNDSEIEPDVDDE